MASDPVPTVRRFYRALTLRVGVFTDSFLGRGRPLAQSRLLFEIGRAGAEVRELRARLDLDSGYLSRLLRSLEKQGLVEVGQVESDLRSRRAQLTAAGVAELDELDQLGDRFAQWTLEQLAEPERSRLVQAMAEVERLLNLSFVRIALDDPDGADARACLAQFAAELDARFESGFDASRSLPVEPGDLRPPRGAFLVARLDGRPVGCGAVATIAPGIGTVKRMWVAPELRGTGVGRRLLLALEHQAAGLGLALLRLETNARLLEAQALYARNGYREVPDFNAEPYADHWFEKRIAAADA